MNKNKLKENKHEVTLGYKGKDRKDDTSMSPGRIDFDVLHGSAVMGNSNVLEKS